MTDVRSLVEACIEQEDAVDWAFVRRVPSTHTWKTVDYIRSLEPARRVILRRALASNALRLFEPQRDPPLHSADADDRELDTMLEALARIWAWEYAGVRTLRAIASDQPRMRPAPRRAAPPTEVVERARAIRPTNARAIRKAVKEAFVGRYDARCEKLDGGEWRYAGTHHGRSFVVSIDYGGWDQLRYAVDYDDPASGLQARGLSYERLVGAGFGHWDALTADNLASSVGLLCGFLERLVGLPEVTSSRPARRRPSRG